MESRGTQGPAIYTRNSFLRRAILEGTGTALNASVKLFRAKTSGSV